MSAPAAMMNELFTHRLSSNEGKEKLAEYGGSYVRDRLREVAFCRKVLPPQQVTRADCQVSVNHDTLVKIVNVEPKSRAMVMSFRGQPTANFIRAPKAEIGFVTISSEMYQKNEQELLAYDMPITKVIEENVVKDIQEIEDREFIIHAEGAVQALQTEANGGVATSLSSITVQASSVIEFSIIKGELARNSLTADAVVRPLQRPDLSNLAKLLNTRRLRTDMFLITEGDWTDLLQWTVEDFGDRLQSETTVDGYKYNTLLGYRYVRTVKTDILRPGNLYAFTSPDFLGKFYVLNNPKFYIDKIANYISFQSWEDIGMALINIASITKLELFAADANPTTNTQGLLANFIPKTEDQLGAANNRVDQGLKFPQINTF
jgi:hypothetical protein